MVKILVAELSSSRPAESIELQDVLTRAEREGFLTESAAMNAEAHCLAARWSVPFSAAIPMRCLDLGSGGGLPALVLALCWPSSWWLLTEVRATRASFLRWAVKALGVSSRVDVMEGDVGRLATRRTNERAFDLITARSFGPPSVVLEVAAPMARPAARVLVSEPPEGHEWPTELCRSLGFRPIRTTSSRHGRWRVLERLDDAIDGGSRNVASIRRSPRF